MLKSLNRKLADWWLRKTTIHQLQGLDDRLLQDLGTKREDIAGFVAELEHN